ncbi:DUF5916 domain-containing protein [Catalinimonas alkaloidigena]|uniref:DUF5916 domain-containing protein n=1 Tax=Catalinimonas alkaloidigena TaxID=1075417 RepID=UPI00240510D5|nr:DUF5916 domain-containing protein [Catalinimonas alkaloidigena]
MKALQLLLVNLLLLSIPLFGQKKNADYRLQLKKSNTAIIVDGSINDVGWEQAQVAKDFHMILPMDTSLAKVKTEVRMTYDDNFLYLIAVCYHSEPGPYIVESLRRDFSFGKNDNFLLFMDPFDDQTNGFSFGANAAGAQWDGLMYDGGSVDLSWDNKWTSEVKNYEDRWVFEAAIPFKTIRYKKGITEWGINFSRLDLKAGEKSSWTPVPRQFPSASLAYTGTLVWDQPPPTVGGNVSIIPYALGGVSRDFNNDLDTDYRGEVGVDAKVAITSSLNLDLTVNPDFSQVEVDQQVTNLDRFELFFPERRQFFLENGDLFANFGYQNIRPFFSRRIGLGVPIRFGARLSGKVNKNWRIGVMNMQTGKVEETGLPAQNFAVAAVQRRVFARSNIGLIVVDKESLNYTPSDDPQMPEYSQYNRNIGLEYNLASSNNLWTGKALYLRSFSPEERENNVVHAANLNYESRKLSLRWQHEYVGEGYTAEVGYVPRRNYIKLNPEAEYRFFPDNSSVVSHGPTISSTYFFNHAFEQTDNESYLAYNVVFQNRSNMSAWVAHNYVQLLQAFDPTNSSGDTLATFSEHHWNAWGTEYESTPNSLFTYSFSTRYGGYFADGKRLNLTTEMGYRFQPYVSISLRASYNNILLPEPWNRNEFWLLGPRLDVTMTNKLFFTAFMQYNQQLDNINLNTRLQWRYQPASDLFIVYTDNYFPEPFGVRNRALVLKFTYWWNV